MTNEDDWWKEAISASKVSMLLVHQFSGDPWGLCALCKHPAYHEIHFTDKEENDN